jgi:hypothetical protein
MLDPKKYYEELKNDICKNNKFALHRFLPDGIGGYTCDLYSEGIRMMCAKYPEFGALLNEITEKYFAENDSGTAYDWDEEKIKERDIARDHLAGAWDTEYGQVRIEHGGQWNETVMFFAFER